MKTPLTNHEILYYEVMTSWWAGWAGWEPLQTLVARYYAGKVNRKYPRYLSALARHNQLELAGFLAVPGPILHSDQQVATAS
jgi:hypothetical protein